MPYQNINGVKIHYKLDGSGSETIVLLNGIMMSTASWQDFVPIYTEENNYQLLRVDFRDQGLSEKQTGEYNIKIHVDDLKQLLDKLEIKKIHLVGISYGAMVGILFANKYQNMLSSLILSNTEAKVTNYLQSVSNIWEEAARLNDGFKFFDISMPLIYSDYFYNNNKDWLKERRDQLGKALNKAWFESLIRLSKSSKKFDSMHLLADIKCPTLLIGGTRDILTPVYEMEKMYEKIPNAKMLIIKDAGHASCYEKTTEFNAAVLGFIAVN